MAISIKTKQNSVEIIASNVWGREVIELCDINKLEALIVQLHSAREQIHSWYDAKDSTEYDMHA